MNDTRVANINQVSRGVRVGWGILFLLVVAVGVGAALWLRGLEGKAPVRGAGSGDLCVIACNIRLDQGKDKANAWVNRRDLLAQTLLAEKPDILGIQETPTLQAVDLLERMEGYAAYPDGRDDRSPLSPLLNFNMTMVLYRKDRFEVIGGDHGTVRDGAPANPWVTAYYTVAVLRDLTGTWPELIVVSTHFRHDPKVATKDGESLNNRITAQRRLHPGAGVILTGDLNADRNSAAYKALVGNPEAFSAGTPTTILRDTYDYAAHRAGDKWGSWHGFTGKALAEWPTDFVLVSEGAKFEAAKAIREGKGDVWRTDHWPVVVRVKR